MSATGLTDERGFTLIEMLVVLAVTALVGALAFPQVERAISRQQFQREVQAMQGALNAARAKAIATAAPLRFEPQVVDGMRLDLPSGGLWFFADGSSTGGEVSMSMDGRSLRIAISGPTGAIRANP